MPAILRVFVCSILMVPLPAFADCAADIAVLKSKLGSDQPAEAESAGKRATDAQAPKTATAVVREEVIGDGRVVMEGGGETVYREAGPALPRENWFGSPPDKAAASAHLAAAQSALQAGDEQACLKAVKEAENVMAAE